MRMVECRSQLQASQGLSLRYQQHFGASSQHRKRDSNVTSLYHNSIITVPFTIEASGDIRKHCVVPALLLPSNIFHAKCLNYLYVAVFSIF